MDSTTNNTILKIQNFKTYFETETGKVKAVDGIDFELKKGETLGIVGESGSGKTVTGLSIMGLVEKTKTTIVSGQIIYTKTDGEKVDLLTLSEDEIRPFRGKEIAMIFQEPMSSLNPVFRCGEQVAEMIELHKGGNKAAINKEVLQWFEQVKLPDVERIYDAYPHQLSGGQKQRVMIAMAISCHPQILIADEPTTALDVTVQKSILALLKTLQKELGISIVFISHDLGVIRQLTDNVVVMQKGLIVEQGKTADIFKQAQHNYTKGLLACRPPLDKRLHRLPMLSDFIKGGEGNIIESKLISPAAMQKRLADLRSQTPLLQVHNLEVSYGSKKRFFGKSHDAVIAVNNLNFDVYPGETLGLVGESGCGKTTLGRAILQLTDGQVKGDVFYKQKSIFKLSAKAMKNFRKEVQIIFQDHYSSLNPRMIVGRAIAEVLQMYSTVKSKNELRELVITLLEKVGMEAEHYARYPHELSGGQRQRICIARALAVEPKFIICDEPVSALDVSVQAQVLNLLKDLQEELGLTYIFISHDLSVVKFMSDRMLVMQNGKIVESGTADEIYNKPQQEYTKELIAAAEI